MAEQISVDRLASSYLANGFTTKLGRVAPFYGRDGGYVMVSGKYLTAAEARRAAAALATVAETLDERAAGHG